MLNIHGPCNPGLAFLALSMFRGPKVFTLHNAKFPDARWRHWIAPYYRWVFRRAAAVIAVSETASQTLGRYADFKSTIIPNGIDGPYWRARPSARYLKPGVRNLVYLGRLEARNGPEVAIEAFSRIAPSLPDVRLLMAGDGPMREGLQARVPAPLRGRVEFLGAVYDERPELLASSSVFLLPARAVSFSIMVLEAFAAGVPVVALPALGSNGPAITGRTSSWPAATALSPSPTPWSHLAAGPGRARRPAAIADAFDWTRIGARILDVYHNVVAPADRIVGASVHRRRVAARASAPDRRARAPSAVPAGGGVVARSRGRSRCRRARPGR